MFYNLHVEICAERLAFFSQGGIYLLNLVDFSVGGFPLLVIGMFELVAISWIYGEKNKFVLTLVYALSILKDNQYVHAASKKNTDKRNKNAKGPRRSKTYKDVKSMGENNFQSSHIMYLTF